MMMTTTMTRIKMVRMMITIVRAYRELSNAHTGVGRCPTYN